MKKYRLLVMVVLWINLFFTGCDPSEYGIETQTGQVAKKYLKNSSMEVHFLDVGQGDCTLILSEDRAMLVDAGDNSMGMTIQVYLQKLGITKLDYLILTHPDADHIGGADVIVTKFDIEKILMTDYKKDSKAYNELIGAMEYKGYKYTVPDVGDEYQIGDASFTILAPNDDYSDANNASIAFMLENGEDSFLFTGDCEEEAELDILKNGMNVDADVLDVGHHGSKTSSCEEFLDEVTPQYAVISCADGNSYGHPHSATLNNLRMRGVLLFRTDEQGTIIAVSSGNEITWNCSPSDSWQAGE